VPDYLKNSPALFLWAALRPMLVVLLATWIFLPDCNDKIFSLFLPSKLLA